MQAIILAAGMGKRLGGLTAHNTKCMVEVNGISLIERTLTQLDRLGLTRIVVVTGYEGAGLRDFIGTLPVTTPIAFVDNPVYDRTNNIYSLMLAKDYLLAEDTLLLESDLIFEDAVLDVLLADPRPNLALVDKFQAWMSGSCMTLRPDDTIASFISGPRFAFADAGSYWKTVNIYKFSAEFSARFYVPLLEAYITVLGNNEYYEQVLRVLTVVDNSQILAKRLTGQTWYEIDDVADLDIAASLFPPTPAAGLALLQSRYGGYWRYPDLLDFCYLVNPHFPDQRLLDELTASLGALVRQYPSGLGVNRLLAGRHFGLSRDLITVGNGAAELIAALLSQLGAGRLGLIAPSFEEYAHRRTPASVFTPGPPDFRYTADDLIAWFGAHPVDVLVLVNPDNPSGNYLPAADVRRLIDWARTENVRLVVDESFVDFADEPDATLLTETILRADPHLVVIKSISKSYGIPGLRLGVLASADGALVEAVSAALPIWNINSLAEFYLQVSSKYARVYGEALALFRRERAAFLADLAGVPGVRVLPTQANYVMAEVGTDVAELAAYLLATHRILIKDLTPKLGRLGVPGHFVRLAIRDAADNARLVAALRAYFTTA